MIGNYFSVVVNTGDNNFDKLLGMLEVEGREGIKGFAILGSGGRSSSESPGEYGESSSSSLVATRQKN